MQPLFDIEKRTFIYYKSTYLQSLFNVKTDNIAEIIIIKQVRYYEVITFT